MSILSDYIQAIGEMVGGELPLGETEKERAVRLALNVHSRHKPQRVVEDVTGDGTSVYDLSDELASWEDDFSKVVEVEYPLDADEPGDNVIEPSAWVLRKIPTDGDVLRLTEDTPAATETIRITYTARHTCTDAACSVAAADDDAVQALAAGHFCRMLAAYYAQSQDSTIEADSVDHSSKRREYEAQAKAYQQLYYDHMGIKEGQVAPASAIQDQDVDHPEGWDRLTHPRRQR